jgi:hypothetical protein
VDPAALRWLELYGHYRAGHLWRAGGVAEQPARYLRAMAVCQAAVGELERDQAEEARRKRG